MEFSSRARWSEARRHPDAEPAPNSKTYRGRKACRRFSSVYPVHLGG